MNKRLLLAGLVALPLLVGALSGRVTAEAIPTWYAGLAKPSFNPPSSVFAPVWTALYAAMGVASFLVARAGLERGAVRVALALYGVQLILNGTWSLVFFGAKSPGWALAEIVTLDTFAIWTTLRFAAVSAAAGWLLASYVAWLAFATVLNASIWWLNRA